MPGTDTERFLQEMKLVKKKKTENVNIHAIYIIIFLKKKQAKNVNIRVKNIKIFPNKKTSKSVNMLANGIEIFLKCFSFFECIKNKVLVFLNE